MHKILLLTVLFTLVSYLNPGRTYGDAGDTTIIQWRNLPESPQKASCRLCAGAYPNTNLCGLCMGRSYNLKKLQATVKEICQDTKDVDACGLIKFTGSKKSAVSK